MISIFRESKNRIVLKIFLELETVFILKVWTLKLERITTPKQLLRPLQKVKNYLFLIVTYGLHLEHWISFLPNLYPHSTSSFRCYSQAFHTNESSQERHVLLYGTIYEDYINSNKNLEAEEKITRFIKSSGSYGLKNEMGWKQNKTKILIALECTPRKNSLSCSPSISPPKSSVRNIKITNSASWLLQKNKQCHQL